MVVVGKRPDVHEMNIGLVKLDTSRHEEDRLSVMSGVSLMQLCYGGEGGQVSATRLLLAGLTKSGIASAVLAVAPEAEMLDRRQTWPEHIPVVEVSVRRRLDLASMIEVCSAVRAYRPRVVLCHSLRHVPAAFLGQLFGRLQPRLVIVEHHSTDLRVVTDNVRSAIALFFSRGIVFLTQDAARRYPLRRFPLPGLRKREVIPHGVVTRFRPYRSAGTVTVIGMAARMVDSKDYETLLRGFEKLRSERTSEKWLLRIAGSGPNKEKIVALADALNLNGYVELVGNVSAKDMPDFFSGLDLYVHCTWGENLSLSLLEAAAWGLPIVASDVPGVNSVFSHDLDAILVRPGDKDALAAAMKSALMHARRLGRHAQLMVSNSYSLRSMAKAYCEFFLDIDEGGPWTQPLGGAGEDLSSI